MNDDTRLEARAEAALAKAKKPTAPPRQLPAWMEGLAQSLAEDHGKMGLMEPDKDDTGRIFERVFDPSQLPMWHRMDRSRQGKAYAELRDAFHNKVSEHMARAQRAYNTVFPPEAPPTEIEQAEQEAGWRDENMQPRRDMAPHKKPEMTSAADAALASWPQRAQQPPTFPGGANERTPHAGVETGEGEDPEGGHGEDCQCNACHHGLGGSAEGLAKSFDARLQSYRVDIALAKTKQETTREHEWTKLPLPESHQIDFEGKSPEDDLYIGCKYCGLDAQMGASRMPCIPGRYATGTMHKAYACSKCDATDKKVAGSNLCDDCYFPAAKQKARGRPNSAGHEFPYKAPGKCPSCKKPGTYDKEGDPPYFICTTDGCSRQHKGFHRGRKVKKDDDSMSKSLDERVNDVLKASKNPSGGRPRDAEDKGLPIGYPTSPSHWETTRAFYGSDLDTKKPSAEELELMGYPAGSDRGADAGRPKGARPYAQKAKRSGRSQRCELCDGDDSNVAWEDDIFQLQDDSENGSGYYHGHPEHVRPEYIGEHANDVHDWMKQNELYPNTWWISDHGNVHHDHLPAFEDTGDGMESHPAGDSPDDYLGDPEDADQDRGGEGRFTDDSVTEGRCPNCRNYNGTHDGACPRAVMGKAVDPCHHCGSTAGYIGRYSNRGDSGLYCRDCGNATDEDPYTVPEKDYWGNPIEKADQDPIPSDEAQTDYAECPCGVPECPGCPEGAAAAGGGCPCGVPECPGCEAADPACPCGAPNCHGCDDGVVGATGGDPSGDPALAGADSQAQLVGALQALDSALDQVLEQLGAPGEKGPEQAPDGEVGDADDLDADGAEEGVEDTGPDGPEDGTPQDEEYPGYIHVSVGEDGEAVADNPEEDEMAVPEDELGAGAEATDGEKEPIPADDELGDEPDDVVEKAVSACECNDPGCTYCGGDCRDEASGRYHRSDMDDREGSAFCNECGADAMESGMFGGPAEDEFADHDLPPPENARVWRGERVGGYGFEKAARVRKAPPMAAIERGPIGLDQGVGARTERYETPPPPLVEVPPEEPPTEVTEPPADEPDPELPPAELPPAPVTDPIVDPARGSSRAERWASDQIVDRFPGGDRLPSTKLPPASLPGATETPAPTSGGDPYAFEDAPAPVRTPGAAAPGALRAASVTTPPAKTLASGFMDALRTAATNLPGPMQVTPDRLALASLGVGAGLAAGGGIGTAGGLATRGASVAAMTPMSPATSAKKPSSSSSGGGSKGGSATKPRSSVRAGTLESSADRARAARATKKSIEERFDAILAKGCACGGGACKCRVGADAPEDTVQKNPAMLAALAAPEVQGAMALGSVLRKPKDDDEMQKATTPVHSDRLEQLLKSLRAAGKDDATAHRLAYATLGKAQFFGGCSGCYEVRKSLEEPEVYFEVLSKALYQGRIEDGRLTDDDYLRFKKEFPTLKAEAGSFLGR